MTLFVHAKDNPTKKFGEDDLETVRDGILVAIDGLPDEKAGKLRTEESGLHQGYGSVRTGNDHTFDWVRETIATMALKDFGLLEAVTASELGMIKVECWVKNRKDRPFELSDFPRRLGRRNPSMGVQRWRHIFTRATPDGSFVGFRVPLAAIEALERLEWRPYCECTRILLFRAGRGE